MLVFLTPRSHQGQNHCSLTALCVLLHSQHDLRSHREHFRSWALPVYLNSRHYNFSWKFLDHVRFTMICLFIDAFLTISSLDGAPSLSFKAQQGSETCHGASGGITFVDVYGHGSQWLVQHRLQFFHPKWDLGVVCYFIYIASLFPVYFRTSRSWPF